MTTRRDFLIKGSTFSLATIGALAGMSGVAFATENSIDELWTLDPIDCGSGSCPCNACLRHAANKVFLSEGDALAGRAHGGCRCRPRAVRVSPQARTQIETLAAAGVSLDRRNAGAAAVLTGVGATSTTTPSTTTTPSASTTTAVEGPTTTPQPTTTMLTTEVEGFRANRAAPDEAILAFTGGDSFRILATGSLAVTAGVTALAMRRSRVATDTESARPDDPQVEDRNGPRLN